MVSDGGVHSQQAHLYALLKMAKQNGVDRVFVHAFMDGRDTLPTNGAGYLEQLAAEDAGVQLREIACVSGRYYAMDRDRRWERIPKAYNAMVDGEAKAATTADPVQGMKDSYNNGVTDEFVVPFVCTDKLANRWRRSATTMPASASTSAPTVSARLRALWRAIAD